MLLPPVRAQRAACSSSLPSAVRWDRRTCACPGNQPAYDNARRCPKRLSSTTRTIRPSSGQADLRLAQTAKPDCPWLRTLHKTNCVCLRGDGAQQQRQFALEHELAEHRVIAIAFDFRDAFGCILQPWAEPCIARTPGMFRQQPCKGDQAERESASRSASSNHLVAIVSIGQLINPDTDSRLALA